MSSNRLIYDTCAYKKTLDQSVGPLSYVLNPIKYENYGKCRMELGLVGGTAVSQIKGNLVDLENDLRGTTRSASLCPSKHYVPNCANQTETLANLNKFNLMIPEDANNKLLLILAYYTYHLAK